jgi:hypothetical protein
LPNVNVTSNGTCPLGDRSANQRIIDARGTALAVCSSDDVIPLALAIVRACSTPYCATYERTISQVGCECVSVAPCGQEIKIKTNANSAVFFRMSFPNGLATSSQVMPEKKDLS